MRNQKGITLIALILTIIVLLILAGVSIAMLTGTDNNILGKASEASEQTAISAAREAVTLAINEALAEYYDNIYVESGSYTIESVVTNALTSLQSSYDGEAKIECTTGSGSCTITITYGTSTETGTVNTTTGALQWN